MATIKDLDIMSILDSSPEEAIENLRQIRLSRRTPVKKAKSTTKKKATGVKGAKAAINNLSPEDIAKLLKELKG